MPKTINSERNNARRKLGLEEATASGTVLQSGGTPVLVLVAFADGEGGYAMYQTAGTSEVDRNEWRRVVKNIAARL